MTAVLPSLPETTFAEYEALKAEQQRLSDEVARLQMMVERMAEELGMSIEKLSGAA